MNLTARRKQHLTRNGVSAHNSHAPAEVDSNRDQSLQAQRLLSEKLRRVTAFRGWFGHVTVAVSVEDGQIVAVQDTETRTHKTRRRSKPINGSA